MSTKPKLANVESPKAEDNAQETLQWLEKVLPRAMHRLTGSEDWETPLLQLPLAQLRLVNALYDAADSPEFAGETMGQLSLRLHVRHNALTQSADRLIQRGLAERHGDPTDRRIVRMRLTPKGYEWVGERRARRLAHLDRLWTLLEPDERTKFLSAVQLLEAVSQRVKAVEIDMDRVPTEAVETQAPAGSV